LTLPKQLVYFGLKKNRKNVEKFTAENDIFSEMNPLGYSSELLFFQAFG